MNDVGSRKPIWISPQKTWPKYRHETSSDIIFYFIIVFCEVSWKRIKRSTRRIIILHLSPPLMTLNLVSSLMISGYQNHRSMTTFKKNSVKSKTWLSQSFSHLVLWTVTNRTVASELPAPVPYLPMFPSISMTLFIEIRLCYPVLAYSLWYFII